MAAGTGVIDPEIDLRRAIELDPSDRNLRFPLVTFLHDAGRWEDAIAVSTEALADFPGDFDMELVHATALVETQRYEAAINVLDQVHVLPSEHSSQAHTLFAQAHTMAGLAALEAEAPDRAAEHLRTAMTWPERLGQGRPYQPEERLQQYALARALRLSGDRDGERRALEAVVGATPAVAARTPAESPYDALAVPALSGLGRTSEGEALEAEHLRLARDGEPAGLGSVEDRLLYRVLTLETPDAAR
jgi:tetratricopeptide (TPR) repeat protein